ncbi:unnamed protein product [Linum trigynum]|uniref:Uncharacterized protein n=1 Tax=Linum trigynum TaxID=586398 RepID=A0AAV2CUB8_9ROSI
MDASRLAHPHILHHLIFCESPFEKSCPVSYSRFFDFFCVVRGKDNRCPPTPSSGRGALISTFVDLEVREFETAQIRFRLLAATTSSCGHRFDAMISKQQVAASVALDTVSGACGYGNLGWDGYGMATVGLSKSLFKCG